MAKSVTKSHLIASMASEAAIKKTEAEKALAALTGAIRAALTKGSKVTLVGFGTFSVAQRAARVGVNPQTKKKIKIAASKSVKFKAGKAMKEAVNR
jgi:DNA-binding protein HU-beta